MHIICSETFGLGFGGEYLVKTYVRIGILMDAMFAKNLFDQVLTLDMYENPSSIPYVWCKAA